MVTRAKRIHGDAARGDLLGEALHESEHSRASRVREYEIFNRLLRGDRSDRDDSSPTSLAHDRHCFAAKVYRADQIQLNGIAIVMGAEVIEETGRRSSSVRHQYVDRAERAVRLSDELTHESFVGDIAGKRKYLLFG